MPGVSARPNAPRRFRANRNSQLNIKCLQDTYGCFVRLVDEGGEVSGVVLERLLDLHDRYGASNDK